MKPYFVFLFSVLVSKTIYNIKLQSTFSLTKNESAVEKEIQAENIWIYMMSWFFCSAIFV